MTAPHDAPTAAELVESVREWLERDVLGSVEGRIQFHTRVAMNVLDIVLREMEMGGAQRERHEQVLRGLGCADDRELADAVREGRFDADLAGLLAALRPVVEDKLAVANPRYAR